MGTEESTAFEIANAGLFGEAKLMAQRHADGEKGYLQFPQNVDNALTDTGCRAGKAGWQDPAVLDTIRNNCI